MKTNIESKILIAVVIICVVLIIIGLIKQRFDLIVNFSLRAIAGILAIYIVNTFLKVFDVNLAVGMNGLTASLIGILGVPGFLLLYGLALFFYIF